MLIGALSLVIVVWLGTSMNFSRMSTFAGLSMTGMRKRRSGVAHQGRPGPAQSEDDHPLVLVDDPDRQVQDDDQNDDDDGDAGERDCVEHPSVLSVVPARRR